MKIAVVGASGLVGNMVVEEFLASGAEVVPIVGTTGSAWRLMSRGIEPRVVSVLDAEALRRAVAGCSHVVNCARGGEQVMLDGLRNLLAASRHAGARKFVHLSSVAVYGDPPPPEAGTEDAPTRPASGSYGDMKLRQDRLVERAARGGLPSVILCPPNIIGPESYFLLQIADALLRGRLPLLDHGQGSCNTVDVRNLARACQLAAVSDVVDGQRMFVVDDGEVTWRDVVEGVRVATACALDAVYLDEETIRDRVGGGGPAPRRSVMRALRHLASSDVRQAIRKDPLLASVDGFVRGAVAKFGGAVEDRLRLMVEGPIKVAPVANPLDELDLRLASMQLRKVRHRADLAGRLIGYRPPVSFNQSMEAFGMWIRTTRGMDRDDWDLRRELFGYQSETALASPDRRCDVQGSA